jgi:ATP-dependent DNA helicase PIF1
MLTATEEEREVFQDRIRKQEQFGALLISLGEASEEHNPELEVLYFDAESRGKKVAVASSRFFNADTECDEAIQSVFPNGHDPDSMYKSVIIAATNEQVDIWNERIQNMNGSEMKEFHSRDYLCEVDDPRDVLKSMLTDDILNRYSTNGVPPHVLKLKVGDICILLRSLSRKDKLMTNTRVRVLRLNTFCVHVQTLTESPKCFTIPRIRFKFQLPWGKSYQMVRTQFPLRLSYAITVNKAQGQEYDRTLYDVRGEAFSHGHAYVAYSRSKIYDTFNILCGPDQVHEDKAVITNIVYSELIASIL